MRSQMVCVWFVCVCVCVTSRLQGLYKLLLPNSFFNGQTVAGAIPHCSRLPNEEGYNCGWAAMVAEIWKGPSPDVPATMFNSSLMI